MRSTMSMTPREWPCAVSTTTTIDAGLAQRRDAIERVRRRADRRADAQRAALVLAGAREFGGLLEVLHGDHAGQLVVAVDDQHLLDAVLVQQRRALLPSARSRAR